MIINMAKFLEIYVFTVLFTNLKLQVLAQESSPTSTNPPSSIGSMSTPGSSQSFTPLPTFASEELSSQSSTSGSTGSALSTSSPSSTVSTGDDSCIIKATLGNYCGEYLAKEGGGSVFSYFNVNTSMDDLIDTIIDDDTISALFSQCEPGDWCLPDSYHEKIYQGMSAFYQTPICSQPLWNCLESIGENRRTCQDSNELYSLLEMVSLLCDMNAFNDLQPECYTRTIEILHVLWSDAARNSQLDYDGPLCADYPKKLIKTFLCTIDACGLKPSVFLREFDPLINVALNSEMVFVKCNLSTVCSDNTTLAPRLDTAVALHNEMNNATVTPIMQSTNGNESDERIFEEEMAEEAALDKVFNQLEQELEKEEMENNKENDKMNMPIITTSSWSDTVPTDNVEQGNNAEQSNQDEMNVSTITMGGDQTVLFGAVTFSVLAFIGLLAIGFMSCKHYRVRRSAAYKRGYSQLSDEESRMLNNYE